MDQVQKIEGKEKLQTSERAQKERSHSEVEDNPTMPKQIPMQLCTAKWKGPTKDN